MLYSNPSCILLHCYFNLLNHHLCTCRLTQPGGLLVIELGHPKDIFQGIFCSDTGFVDCWEISESGNVDFANEQVEDGKEEEGRDEEIHIAEEDRVLVEYGREGDAFDVGTQILERTVGFSLFNSDGDLISSKVSTVPQRQFTLQEMEMISQNAGWSIKSIFGDLNMEIGLYDDEAYRMVLVLSRNPS